MISKNTDNARITIVNEQTLDGSFDTLETKASGKFYEKDGKFYILYSESEASTIIKTDGRLVSVRRRGAYDSQMIYDTQREHEFLYSTPYGQMAMTLVTKKADIDLSENGGNIYLEYELHIGGAPCKNNMKISVVLREKGTKK